VAILICSIGYTCLNLDLSPDIAALIFPMWATSLPMCKVQQNAAQSPCAKTLWDQVQIKSERFGRRSGKERQDWLVREWVTTPVPEQTLSWRTGRRYLTLPASHAIIFSLSSVANANYSTEHDSLIVPLLVTWLQKDSLSSLRDPGSRFRREFSQWCTDSFNSTHPVSRLSVGSITD
jgi:hypothetical protein